MKGPAQPKRGLRRLQGMAVGTALIFGRHILDQISFLVEVVAGTAVLYLGIFIVCVMIKYSRRPLGVIEVTPVNGDHILLTKGCCIENKQQERGTG